MRIYWIVDIGLIDSVSDDFFIRDLEEIMICYNFYLVCFVMYIYVD